MSINISTVLKACGEMGGMNLVPAKSWLRRHKKWRSKQTADIGISRVSDLEALDERYLKLVQINALKWCRGKADREIEHRILGLIIEL